MTSDSFRPVLPALVALAALLLVPTGTNAQQADTPHFAFDGFGTLGLVYSSEDRADFLGNPLRPNGPGHTNTVSPDVDSRLGAQVAATLTPKLTAVVQVIAEQTHEDEYTPGLEWAYVDYAFTPEFSVRAGRMPVNTLFLSDSRKVSYANPWMRPPVELYGLSPITRGESVEASYRLHTGDWTNTLQVSFGRGESKFDGGSAEAKNAWSVNNMVQHGGFTARAAYSHGQLDIDAFDPIFAGFRAFGPEGDAIANRYEVDDTPFDFLALAAAYDPGSWFGMAEFAWTDFHSVIGEKLAGYVTAGYRFGRVTPYVTYSRVGALSETAADGLTVEAYPPEAQDAAAGLNAFLNSFLRSTAQQQNLALGGRWDVATRIAIKLQVDFIDVLYDSSGTFGNQQPGWEPGGSARLLSLATVFVF